MYILGKRALRNIGAAYLVWATHCHTARIIFPGRVQIGGGKGPLTQAVFHRLLNQPISHHRVLWQQGTVQIGANHIVNTTALGAVDAVVPIAAAHRTKGAYPAPNLVRPE